MGRNLTLANQDAGNLLVRKVAIDLGPKGTTPVSAGDTEIPFCGYRYDPETADLQARNRNYHPELGRFLQRDPAGYVDGMNVYQYVRNNPVLQQDPLGLEPPQATQAASSFYGGVPGQLVLSSNRSVSPFNTGVPINPAMFISANTISPSFASKNSSGKSLSTSDVAGITEGVAKACEKKATMEKKIAGKISKLANKIGKMGDAVDLITVKSEKEMIGKASGIGAGIAAGDAATIVAAPLGPFASIVGAVVAVGVSLGVETGVEKAIDAGDAALKSYMSDAFRNSGSQVVEPLSPNTFDQNYINYNGISVPKSPLYPN